MHLRSCSIYLVYFNLREFALNSRHPSLLREEGGLRAAVKKPLPLDPGDPRDPRENSARPFFVDRHRT